MRSPSTLLVLLLLSLPSLLAPTGAGAGPRSAEVLESALVLEAPGVSRREPLHSDAVEAQIVAGHFRWPVEGEILRLPDGTARTWRQASVDEKGILSEPSLSGGYVAWSVHSDERRIALLEATGHSAVLVNGTWRAGDHYSFGWWSLPVALRKGENRFLFRAGRGRFQAKLLPVEEGVFLETRDATLPDLVTGRHSRELGALVVVNASERVVDGLELVAGVAGAQPTRSRVPLLPPLGAVKVPFTFDAAASASSPAAASAAAAASTAAPVSSPPAASVSAAAAAAAEQADALPLQVDLRGADGAELSSVTFDLEVVEPSQVRRVTFSSEVDGSVQYYGLQPQWPEASKGERPALILTTHGAGVSGTGQAKAYAPKSWAHVVAPTNRRPYGFDWEDWGRLDALEALAHARESLGTDPRRQVLTGHSMGGHGAWHLGVSFPDRFAAVGPSAGWISFRSYADSAAVEHQSEAAELLDRAWKPSDTLALIENLDSLAVFILHGADDDNVPATEAQAMRQALEARGHRDLHHHEEPGQGHWWNLSEEPGADCVDWPPMLDLFARRAIPEAPRALRFVTAHPGVSARSHWAQIWAAERPFVPSRIALHHDPLTRRFSGTTSNVARLALDVGVLRGGGAIRVELDGRSFETDAPEEDRLLLERRAEDWVALTAFPAGEKSPERAGPFRDAFRNRALLVYGTRGTNEENAWALARARLDQESFRYRGNGSFELLPDSAFRPEEHEGRNVVLYGGRHVNGAWDSLLADSPIVVDRQAVVIGKRRLEGEDLAVLFIRPLPGSAMSSVGVVAGTGMRGARLTDRIPYFVSGIAYPDFTVLDSKSLSAGAQGLRAAGYFGLDWSLEEGEWAMGP